MTNPWIGLVAFVGLAIICIGVTCMLVPLWFGNQRMYEVVRQANLTALTDDSDKAQAMVRGLPAVWLGMMGLTVGGGVALHDTLVNGNELLTDGAFIALVIGLLVMVLGLLLDWTVVRFNQPKFLVPPHLRGEPGFNEVLRDREERGDHDLGRRRRQPPGA